MGTLLDNPKKVYPVLVVLIVGLFALSAVGQGKDDDLWWVGAIGWFGFLITLLATIVYSITVLFRRRRRASAA